jgi:hypothetical protein
MIVIDLRSWNCIHRGQVASALHPAESVDTLLASNVMFKLLNGEALICYDAFDQIADRHNAYY